MRDTVSFYFQELSVDECVFPLCVRVFFFFLNNSIALNVG